MFMELIATFIAGLGAAGVVLLVNRVTSGRLPRWVMPVAAGATMIGFAIWSEMSWADRTAATLPDGLEVADTVSRSIWWRPWTYARPQTVRMMAVDTASIRTNDAAEDVRLVDLYLFERWQPPHLVPLLVRCSSAARADVTESALADPDNADWRSMPDDSPLIRFACKESSNG